MYPKLTNRTMPGGQPVYTYVCKMKERSKRSVCSSKNANGNILDAAIIDQENIGVLFEVLGLIISRGATPSNISEFTELRRLKSCTLTCEGNLPYHLDGDYAGTLTPGEKLIIERLPHKLKVCMPTNPVPLSPLERMMAHPAIAAMREKIGAFNEA